MCGNNFLYFLLIVNLNCGLHFQHIEFVEIFDLTNATTRKNIYEFYNVMEKQWKVCSDCGVPVLGTVMHFGKKTSMKPADTPTQYLLTRLQVIDVSSLAIIDPVMSLTLDVALQWNILKHDPIEPTLLLFKFGWSKLRGDYNQKNCACYMPGLSYELAEWIANNMSHVVGVGTDTPSLESDQTREFSTRTVSNLLGNNGIYIIENAVVDNRIPERGCLAVAMPLKILNENYVPTRLIAFCPSQRTEKEVAITMKSPGYIPVLMQSYAD